MAKMPGGLGRGLGALLGEDAFRPAGDGGSGDGGVLHLPLSRVENDASQPRKRFDEEGLEALAESIRQHGVIQPLIVRQLPTGWYRIVAGERRWRAARIAGLDEVPAVVIEVDDRTAAELALVENLQREDLGPLEEAAGYRALAEHWDMTQEEIAQRVGKSRSAVANALRLLDLTEAVRSMVDEGSLSAGHARALLSLPPEIQEQAAQEVVRGGLSVRQTEALVRRMGQDLDQDRDQDQDDGDPPPEETAGTVDYTAIAQRDLSSRLGRGVRIVQGRKKGRIELDWYGLDDLNELLDALSAIGYRTVEEGQE